MLRPARPRSFIVFLLVGVLVLTSIWHMSYADFHSHAESGGEEVVDVHPLPTDDAGEDRVSIHPVHVLAYLSATPAITASTRAMAAFSTEPLSVHSRPPSGLFRPPRS